MSAGRCYGIIKYLMVFVNLLFFILSIAMVTLAIWMLVDPTFYVSLTQDPGDYQISTYMFLFIGILLLIVSFLGCYGACRESSCQLITFFSFLLIIIVAQVAAGIWAYTNSDSLEAIVHSTIKSIVHGEYYNDENRRELFDHIQSGLKCCGVERPSDWNPNSFQTVNVGISHDIGVYHIPKSCCRTDIENSTCSDEKTSTRIGEQIDYNLIYEEGCAKKIIETLRYNMNLIYIFGLIALIIEVIGLTFAIILACGASRSSRYKA